MPLLPSPGCAISIQGVVWAVPRWQKSWEDVWGGGRLLGPRFGGSPETPTVRRVPATHTCPPSGDLVAQLAPAQWAVGARRPTEAGAGVGFMGRASGPPVVF